MIPTRHPSALPQCLFGLVLICWPLLDTDSLAVVRQLNHIRYFVKGEPGLADLQGNTLTDPIFYFIFPIYQGDPVLFGVERAGRDACWHRRVYNFSYRCTTVPTWTH